MSAIDGNLDTAFLAGGGELGQLMRSRDWAGTALGDPKDWPRSLKTVVRIMLTSRQPIWIGWGPELLYLYNDAYQSIIGGKHPWALGRPIAEVWRELWGDIAGLLDSAMKGDGTFVESQLLIMERNGYPEETYYTFSYSPIPGDDGQAAGIICANSDETRRVIGERQLALLRQVAADATDAKTVDAAVARCIAAMGSNDRDLPFALVLLRTQGEQAFRLAGHTGVAPGSEGREGAPWFDRLTALDPRDERWRFEQVLRSGQPHVIEALPQGVHWPSGRWRLAPRRAMVLPIAPSGDAGEEGVLVVGLNPYRLPDHQPDESYQGFLVLVAQQVASAIAHAQAYERERRRAEELAELDRAKTQFFSNVSHEFRTPLTLMLGPLADTLADASLPAGARQQLEMVERNVLRLSKLVNALLAFSRIEAGRQESVFRPTDLSRLTAGLASSFHSAMARAGLGFEVRCPPLSQPVYVDPEQWERIVLNLLSNALKFTFNGAVTVSLREAGDEAVLEVADTGVGVPEAELPRLFERFHRVQGAHSRTHEGSGIGLALVQELVKLHKGQVAVRSTLGEGTVFTVRLPMGCAHLPRERIVEAGAQSTPFEADAEAGADRARQAEAYVLEASRWLPERDGAAPGAGEGAGAGAGAEGGAASPDLAPTALLGERYRSTWGARIVIADDNADMRQYLHSLLQPRFRVEATTNGLEALEAVRRERPALLLSDVMMPRLDGFGLLAAVRGDARLRTLPVLLLSARAGEEATVEGLVHGADDYLVKPFSARELLARVAAMIELDRVRRATEEQVRLFLASARLFTWDIDLVTNEVALSHNAEEVIGMPPRDQHEGIAAVHPEDRDRHQAAIRQAVHSRGELWDEIRYLRPDNGDTRWLEIRGRVICDERDEPVRLSGISFDITERKRLEAVLRDSDRRKDEFLAMLAHELRNPMAPIRHAGELMLRLGPTDERMRRAAEIINRQVGQLTRMVDDLLDVSRITRGRIELERQPVELSAVLTAAIEAVEPGIRARRHTLAVSSGLPLTVVGDAARLQQCIVNLLANAVKYTDPGGRIDVALLRMGEHAIVRVSDTGAGISPDVLPAIFDLFVQSERTLDRSHGGLGIGLSVVKRLIEMHGGEVRAHSAGVGQGASFEIRLALAPAPLLAEQAGKRPSAAQRRVLVVDDNRDAAESLSLVLQSEGHEVRTVFSAHEALAMLQSWVPEVVFLDIGLPEMNGYDVASRLRQYPALHRTRLVALTGYGQPADKQRAIETGFHAHLVKPAAWEDILQVLAA